MKYLDPRVTHGSGPPFLSIVTPASFDWFRVTSTGTSVVFEVVLALIVLCLGAGALKRLAIMLANSVAVLVNSIPFSNASSRMVESHSVRKLGRENASS